MNDYVRDNGPMRPVRPFRSALQAFYSRTKRGVGAATQLRLQLNSLELTAPWQQKTVLYVLNTLMVNSFIACRLKVC